MADPADRYGSGMSLAVWVAIVVAVLAGAAGALYVVRAEGRGQRK